MSEMTETGTKRYKLKEVCIRLAEGHPLYSDVPLSSPTAALDVMRKELSQYDREVLCVVNLNNKLKPSPVSSLMPTASCCSTTTRAAT